MKRLAEASGRSRKQIVAAASGGLPFALKIGDPDLRLENVGLIEVPHRAAQDGTAAHIIGYTDSDGIAGLQHKTRL